MLDHGAIITFSTVLLFAAVQIDGSFPPQPGSTDDIAYLVNEETSPQSEAGSSQFSIDRAPDGLFHVTALINGKPVDMAIDTGASRSVVAQSDADRVGLIGRADHYSNMQTLNGNIRLQRVKLKELKVGNRKMNDLDIVLGPEQLSQSVVGLDALRRSGPILIDADRLTFLGDEELHR